MNQMMNFTVAGWFRVSHKHKRTRAHKHTHRHKHTHTHIHTYRHKHTHTPLTFKQKGKPMPQPCVLVPVTVSVTHSVSPCTSASMRAPSLSFATYYVCLFSLYPPSVDLLTVMIVCPSYPIISFFAFYSSCHSRVNTSIFLASVSLTQCCLCHTHTHTPTHTHTHTNTHMHLLTPTHTPTKNTI